VFESGAGFLPWRIWLYSSRLIDSSVIPIPESMDALAIALSARNQELWFYYAVVTSRGSVIGSYLTYRLARKGGRETLPRKFPARRLQKVYKVFARWGFAAMVIVAVPLPPAPVVAWCSLQTRCNIP
jgi:membrane protein YqaA with SNARE-associated domain